MMKKEVNMSNHDVFLIIGLFGLVHVFFSETPISEIAVPRPRAPISHLQNEVILCS